MDESNEAAMFISSKSIDKQIALIASLCSAFPMNVNVHFTPSHIVETTERIVDAVLRLAAPTETALQKSLNQRETFYASFPCLNMYDANVISQAILDVPNQTNVLAEKLKLAKLL